MKILPFGAELLHEDRQTERRMNGRTDREICRHDEANFLWSRFC